MPLILNIETTTKNCSVALGKNGTLISCLEIATDGYAHAEKLHVFIKQILHNNHYTFSDLDAVAVSAGPGSYTGLRIGVSAVKGLCYTLKIPMIAVDTLTVLAGQLNVSEGVIIPMLDARRMEVYTAIFDNNHTQIVPLSSKIIDKHAFIEIATIQKHIIGDAQEKCKTFLTENFKFYTAIQYPSAREMVTLSYKQFLQNNFVDVAYFEPNYLKNFFMTIKKRA